ncbi:MAG TPA: hypothetical protein VG272_04000 [Candidatus Acidoferrales bacterium]|jgi:hypothetical protein|nr:hypothetical protein [Candidatus Acidoferrales bacterium]
MNNRIMRGFFWGMVATILMTTMHILIWAVTGRLTVMALATRTMPAMIIAKMFGTGLSTPVHLLLAMAIHLGYGGLWGAILFALTPRVTIWKGLAMGAFLYVGAQVFLLPLLGRGMFGAGSPDRMFGIWFSIATHSTFGASLGWFGSLKEYSAGTGQKPAPAPGD